MTEICGDAEARDLLKKLCNSNNTESSAKLLPFESITLK